MVTASFCYAVIDAWGKPGAGIKGGNIVWLGNFDECMAVKSGRPSNTSFFGDMDFDANYCSIGASMGSAAISFAAPGRLLMVLSLCY